MSAAAVPVTFADDHAHDWEPDSERGFGRVRCGCGKRSAENSLAPAEQVRCFARGLHQTCAVFAVGPRTLRSWARGNWQVFASLRPEVRPFESLFWQLIEEGAGK